MAQTASREKTKTQTANAEAEAGQAIVRCAGLNKVFKDFWMRPRVKAVNDVHMEVRKGEVFGLLGPNGSGKSTTIKLILGLLSPTSGRISVFGKRPEDVSVKEKIGYLPEDSYLYRFLNARETLDYYGRLFHQSRQVRRRRIDMLLEMVGLEAAQNRPVGEYSKGMQRRIGLAQALINDPQLLILDEPTTGMDPIGTKQIKSVIQSLAERGKTILLCSHLLADVEEVCDRVSIMFGGRVVEEGTLADLLTDKQSTTIEAGKLDAQTISKVQKIITDAGVKVDAVSQRKQTLEQLFLNLVERERERGAETSGAQSGGRIAKFLVDADSSDQSSQTAEDTDLLAELTSPESASPATPPAPPAQSSAQVSPSKAVSKSEKASTSTSDAAQNSDSDSGSDSSSDAKAKQSSQADVELLGNLSQDDAQAQTQGDQSSSSTASASSVDTAGTQESGNDDVDLSVLDGLVLTGTDSPSVEVDQGSTDTNSASPTENSDDSIDSSDSSEVASDSASGSNIEPNASEDVGSNDDIGSTASQQNAESQSEVDAAADAASTASTSQVTKQDDAVKVAPEPEADSGSEAVEDTPETHEPEVSAESGEAGLGLMYGMQNDDEVTGSPTIKSSEQEKDSSAASDSAGESPDRSFMDAIDAVDDVDRISDDDK